MRIVSRVGFFLLVFLSLCATAMAADWTAVAAKAEQGDAASQRDLGVRYLEGRGVPQDYGKAEYWLRKAAEQGSAQAQFRLGRLYDKGTGVTQDYPGAAAWYRKAAEQGVAAAQNNLGNLDRDGRGVDQDHAEAVSWYRKAVEQGDAAAETNLGLMYDGGLGVAQESKQALFWLQKAAKQGNRKAQLALRTRQNGGRSVVEQTPSTTAPQAEKDQAVLPSPTARRGPVVTPSRPHVKRVTGIRVVRGKKTAVQRRQTAVVRYPKKRVAHRYDQPLSALRLAGNETTVETRPSVSIPRADEAVTFEGSRREAEPPVAPRAAPTEATSGNVTGSFGASSNDSPASTNTRSERTAQKPMELSSEVPVLHSVFRFNMPDERKGSGVVEQELTNPAYQSTPEPMGRYVDNGNGTITDRKKGLVGLKNANCFGRQKWADSQAAVQDLASGTCQLTDGSHRGDWRLLGRDEMYILLDWQESGLFMNGLQSGYYWSKTLHEGNPNHVWYLMPSRGMLYNGSQERKNAVWPVRSLTGP